jgi:hypothetical protein
VFVAYAESLINEFYGPGAHKKKITYSALSWLKSLARRGRQIITDSQPGLKENM